MTTRRAPHQIPSKPYEYSTDQIEFLANIVRDHIDLSRHRALEDNEIQAARGALRRIVEQAQAATTPELHDALADLSHHYVYMIGEDEFSKKAEAALLKAGRRS